MRLNERNKRTIYLKARTVTKDTSIGETTTAFGTAVEVAINLQPAGGQADVAQFGQLVSYVYKGFLSSDISIKAFDGACINVASTSQPDYVVKSVRNWLSHNEVVFMASEVAQNG